MIIALAIPIPGIPSIQSCIGDSLPNFYVYFWVPTICIEVLFAGLALYKGYKYFRIHGYSPSMNTLLFRDSYLYFVT